MNGCEIGCAWSLVTKPTVDPVSLEEAKRHARILDSRSDDDVLAFIKTATEAGEAFTGRGFLTQTLKLVLDGFANIVPLPMAAPLQNDSGASPSTAVIVQYYDADGVLQTLATSVYDVDTVSRPGRVVLKPDQTWPATQSLRRKGVVEITYVVGWTTPDLVPERIKQGIRQYVAYLELDRDGLQAQSIEAQKAAERCWSDRVEWTAPQWGW